MKKLRVYTGGTFDLFHLGHVNFLRKCSAIGDVYVSLNTDEFIEAYKGQPPVMSYDERLAVLKSCKYVKEVIPNVGGPDSKPSILSISPNVIAIGTDWARKDYYSQMKFTQDWLDSHDIYLCYIPYTQSISSTDIKDRLKSRKN